LTFYVGAKEGIGPHPVFGLFLVIRQFLPALPSQIEATAPPIADLSGVFVN